MFFSRSTISNTDYALELCYSYDGGYTYGNWASRSLGAIGEYGKRLLWRRMGIGRHRTLKIRVTSPVKCDVISASMSAHG